MIAPQTTISIRDQILKKIQTYGYSHIDLIPDLVSLFSSFGASNRILTKTFVSYLKKKEIPPFQLSSGDRALAWLAITTAQKLEPLWLQLGFDPNDVVVHRPYYSYNPFLMMSLAKDVLQEKASILDVSQDYFNAFGDRGLAALANSDPTKKKSLSIYAAYSSFAVTLLGNEQKQDDFLSYAIQAYSISEEILPAPNIKNEVEDLQLDIVIGDKSFLYPYDSIDQIPFGFEPSTDQEGKYVEPSYKFEQRKQIEFWEWWLTEAIPQAWAMVEE